MKKNICFAAALLTLVWGCSENNSTSVQTPDAQQASSSQQAAEKVNADKTKEVLDHHWVAFTENNLEEVMADYTEESVLVTPDKTYKGLAEIRQNFENAFVKFPKDKTPFKLNKSIIDGRIGYILWQAKTPTFDLTYATDTFIIEDGKIISQTFAGVANMLQK